MGWIIVLVILLFGWIWYRGRKQAKQTEQFLLNHYGTKRVSGSRIFYCKAAGVTKKNKDGTSRQKLVKKLSKGDILYLIPDPTNPHDSNAVKILDDLKQTIGYLPARHAAELQHEIQSGRTFFAQVTGVTGGGWGKNYGVNLAIYKTDN